MHHERPVRLGDGLEHGRQSNGCKRARVDHLDEMPSPSSVVGRLERLDHHAPVREDGYVGAGRTTAATPSGTS